MKINIKEVFPDLIEILSIGRENDLFYIMNISLKNNIFKEVTLDNMFNCITEQIIEKNEIKFIADSGITIENEFIKVKQFKKSKVLNLK